MTKMAKKNNTTKDPNIKRIEQVDEIIDLNKREEIPEAKNLGRNEEALSDIIKAEILRDLGRLNEALDVIETALNKEPDNSIHLTLKAVILDDMGRFDEALDTIDKGLKKGEDPIGLEYKASILKSMGRYDEALSATRNPIGNLSTNDSVLATVSS